MENQPPRRRVRGRGGSRRERERESRTAQGGDEDGGSGFVRRCCCGSIFVTSPSPTASPYNAAGRDGLGGETPGSPSALPGFRGTQGWVPVADQRGGKARGKGRVQSSGKERGGSDKG